MYCPLQSQPQMLLHQATNAMALGTRDQPIHVGTSHLLERPIISTSLSLPQRPLTTTHVLPKAQSTSLGKDGSVSSPFVISRAHNPSLVAAPMTANSPDIVQSLKRKRGNTEADVSLEQVKRSKKSERKRRKRERRAARMAELCNKVPSHHSHDTRVDFNLVPGHAELSSSQGRLLPGVLLATAMRQAENSPPESLLGTLPRGSHSRQPRQGQSEMIAGPEIALNGQRSVPVTSHSPMAPQSTPTSLLSVQKPLLTHDKVDMSGHSARGNLVPVINQAPKPVPTGSASLNRKIKERMALLIGHQRLASEAGSPPPLPLPQTSNYTPTTSNVCVDNTIASKQNCLDQAIADNKAALALLGTSRTKEQKLALIKAVTERNKLITQLTTDIKTQLDALRPSAVTGSAPSPPENPVPKFKWPETEFPLYLVIANEDEDLNSAG